jgi:hypothetical protein
MAKALVSCAWDNALPGTPAGRVTIDVKVIYVGTDLPGGILLDRDIVTVNNVDLSIQPAQIVSAIASAVRTRASTLGVNVGANEIILPDLVKG